ncbi:hypothetical protein Dimus_001028 [Dionaea muscipula]
MKKSENVKSNEKKRKAESKRKRIEPEVVHVEPRTKKGTMSMKLSKVMSKVISLTTVASVTMFGKRDVASFMDLSYIDYLLTMKKPHHELPYGELRTRIFHAFDVPLNDKEAKQHVETDNGKKVEEVVEAAGSDSVDKFFDAEEGETVTAELPGTSIAQPDMKKKGKGRDRGVNLSGTIPDYDLIHLQAEFDRALKVNARFQELLQQVKPHPPAPPSS